MAMTPALAETLCMVAQAARHADDDWWIIGSAAVALHGGDVDGVPDVDLLMSSRDAKALLGRVGGRSGGAGPSARFLSRVFGIWDEPPIRVEVFGGFQLSLDGAWREVSFATREPVTVAGEVLYVPSAPELIRLLHAFGRPKDVARAKLMGG
jgi:hypothetical protein